MRRSVRPRAAGRRDGAGAAPVRQESLTLGGREERQGRDAPVRIGRGRAQKRLEMSRHPLDPGRIEQIGGVLERAAESRIILAHR